ncbi:hypothetical protein JOC54_001713 [Alkalihalobacillus xiaoxiensis]|uniref:DUF3955 domain-containing protein n=1 Tax=Shouchella xiaoxiensis TaxID=766895 RepID=A0ABS2SSG7_9BACI|nr:hypothetical protein [Shouchella xiaoxiensis]MBM7838457.1 hypothetical protein [Shouchella xiaoxiensis]
MKQRSIICILLACILGAYAFERLPFDEGGLNQVFAYSWLGFCAVVIVGNGLAFIHSVKKQKGRQTQSKTNVVHEKQRQFG